MLMRLGLLLTLVMGVCPQATADVIFDNCGGACLGLGGPYVVGPESPCVAPAEVALRFVVPEGVATIYSLDVATLPLSLTTIGCRGSALTTLWISVYSDAGGVPGIVLDQGQIEVLSTTPALMSVSFGGGVFLIAGSSYWLVATGLSNSHHLWGYSPSSTTGECLARNRDYPWQHALCAAATVEGTPQLTVPARQATWGRIKALYF